MTPTAAPASAPVAPTRRAVLLGAGGVGLLLAGCSTAEGPADSRADGPTPATTSSPTTGQDDADADLLAQAREAVAATAALVAAARLSAPSLRTDLTPLLGLHRAHAEALGRPLEPSRPARRAAPPGPLLALVRDREEQLQTRLVDLSLAADSGALARLLASMSAGLAQQLAVLPVPPGRRGAA